MTGIKKSPARIRDYDYALCRGYEGVNIDFPDEYILPEEYIPQVYNQEDVGSCAAHTITSCAESEQLKKGENIVLSKGFSYSRREFRPGYDGPGLYMDDAMVGATKVGFVPYEYFPYNKEVPEIIEAASLRDDLLAIAGKIKPSAMANLCYALKVKTWDNIRKALYIDHCAVALVSYTHFRESHAVMGIGFTNKHGNDTGDYVIFQNSWGKEWSLDGRSELPLDSIDEAYVFIWDEIKLPFTDVAKEAWYYKDIEKTYLSGLIKGVTETTFEPMTTFKRCDLAIIVSRMLKSIENSVNAFVKTKKLEGAEVSYSYFKTESDCKYIPEDVCDTDYFYKEALIMLANDIMPAGSLFNPDETVTRKAMAEIICNVIAQVLNLLKTAFSKDFVLPKYPVPLFEDANDVYVNLACEFGILNGYSSTEFAPLNLLKRCEGAAIMNRLFKVVDELIRQAA